ncbi:MAG TPA: hypothetical protein VIJ93_00580 [bacterium]
MMRIKEGSFWWFFDNHTTNKYQVGTTREYKTTGCDLGGKWEFFDSWKDYGYDDWILNRIESALLRGYIVLICVDDHQVGAVKPEFLEIGKSR